MHVTAGLPLPMHLRVSHKWLAAVFSLCIGTLMGAGLSGCSSAQRPRQLALITPMATSELWKSMHAGAYRATQQHGVRLYWNGPTEDGDVERQIEILEHEAEQRVLGVVLAPTHASALISAVAEARRANIPVVLAGTRLASSAGMDLPAVLNDETKTGELAAKALAAQVPAGEVAIVGVDPSNSSNRERVHAFEQAIGRWPSMRVVEKFYTGPNASTGAEGDPVLLLTRHPGLRAIFSPSLAGTRVAYSMLHSRGGGERLRLVVCEQDAELFEPLRHGEIDAVIAIDVFQIGYRAANQLLQHLATGAPTHDEVVEPILITWDNVRDPAVQHRLRPYSGYDK